MRFRPVIIIAVPSDPRKRENDMATKGYLLAWSTGIYVRGSFEKTIFLRSFVRFFRLPS